MDFVSLVPSEPLVAIRRLSELRVLRDFVVNLLVEQLHERHFAHLEIPAKVGPVIVGHGELDGETEDITVKGDHFPSAVGDEADVGESFEHVGQGFSTMPGP